MRTEDIFDLLDAPGDSKLGESNNGRIPLPGLSSEDIQSLRLQGNPVAALAIETTDKAYVTLHRHRNVTSNSILQTLHACPRRFIQEKILANSKVQAGVEVSSPNIDFVFGHSVGAGVQTYLAFDRNLDYALYATFLSWKYKWDLGKEDYNLRKKKTIERAVIAVEMFAHWWGANFDEWEIYRLPSGRPAVELSFCIDFGRYKYFGHIDLVLRNKRTGRIAIGENKTTGYSNPNPAVYQNSGQAIGYALVLDQIVGELADYDVLYYAYSTPGEEWHHFPFAKTTAAKLEWVQDRLIDNGHIEQYFQLQHFPKNGGSCFQFNRQCQFFGECDLVDKERMEALPELTDVVESYPVDYYYDVNALIGHQAGKV
jgi:hypothetical protein